MNASDEVSAACSELRALRSRAEETTRQSALVLARLSRTMDRRRRLLDTRRRTTDALRQLATKSLPHRTADYPDPPSRPSDS